MVERQRRDNEETEEAILDERIGTKHVQILLDRSGSMAILKDAMEESYGGFLREQMAIPGAGDIKFVLSQFDTQGVKDVEVGTLLSAKPLTLVPRGGTPLYDSILSTISNAEKRMASDDVMLFVVITDGGNNEGTATKEEVGKRIAEKMDNGWAFIYLGANQDAWAVSRAMGFAQNTSLTYDASVIGTQRTYGAISNTVGRYRKVTKRSAVASLKIKSNDKKRSMPRA